MPCVPAGSQVDIRVTQGEQIKSAKPELQGGTKERRKRSMTLTITIVIGFLITDGQEAYVGDDVQGKT